VLVILATRDGSKARCWIDTPLRDVALCKAWEAYVRRHGLPPAAARSLGDEETTAWKPDLDVPPPEG
jgi:hypothetical protein